MHCEGIAQSKEFFSGCSQCKAKGIYSNHQVIYDYKRINEQIKWPVSGRGLWKYKTFLPVDKNTQPVSLQEGNTPLIHLKKLGEKIGLSHLYIKDESKNPTWSYKDRLCSVAITRAVEDGAKVITASSTGNHGASTAAYAAAAGLPCVIFTTPEVPETMKTLMQSYGAIVIALPTFEDRWKIMRKCVEQYGWYPISGYEATPLGSNFYGIEGYKTIAFEIFEELRNVPDFVAVPTAYGDGLYGIWNGMVELREIGISSKLPKMIASEVFGSYKQSLKKSKIQPIDVPSTNSKSISIATARGTYQGLKALRDSNGLAEISTDTETMKMQKMLATMEGIYAEPSSVTSLVAISKLLKKDEINPDDTVVSIMTSTGLKDPQSTAEEMPDIDIIDPDLNTLKDLLEEKYNMFL